MQPGYYVKVNDKEVFTSPYLLQDLLSAEVRQSFLSKSFEDTSDAVRYFKYARSSEGNLVSSMEDLDDRKAEVFKAMEAKSPAPKQRKELLRTQYEDLAAKFNNLTLKTESGAEGDSDSGILLGESEQDVEDKSFSPRSWMGQISSCLQSLVNGLSEDCALVDILSNQVQELFVQIGLKPPIQNRRIQDTQDAIEFAPSLWVAVSQINDELINFKRMVMDKLAVVKLAEHHNTELETSMDMEMQNLTKSITQGFVETERKLEDIQGVDLDPISDPYLNVALCSREIQAVENELASLQCLVDQITKNGGCKAITINVGRHSFNSMEEFGGWVDTYLPPTFPFRMFMDVFYYLQRIKSLRDAATEQDTSDMEKQKKLKLMADEEITINSYNHPLPRLFNGGTNPDTPQSDIWLPGISVASKWENDDGTSGVKITMRRMNSLSMRELRSSLNGIYLTMKLI